MMSSSEMQLPSPSSLLANPADAGERKNLNSELWHACAGPLVSLPSVGSRVVYLPQGHSEQVAASTQKEADAHIPAYPNLPPQLICQLHDVILHADMETDEVYCRMVLQPITWQEKESSFVPDMGSQSRQPTIFFYKTLTASDTSTHGGFSIPRRAAEKVFPPLDYSQQPPAQELVACDLHETEWKFRHIYRGQPKRHLLTTGWSVFVSAKRLTAGDSVLFIRNDKGELLLGIRRANRPQTVLPSSVLSSDSMHIGVLAAAAHAANTNSRFTVFYNPRASPSEFVIPYAKFEKAVYHTRVSVGMRFRMLFETEESSVRRYMGTITDICDLDPVRWPNSQWRSIKVGWDESTACERQRRVSLWEIEPLTTFLVYPPTTSWRLKHPWPQPVGASFSSDLEMESLKQQSMWMPYPNANNGINMNPLLGSAQRSIDSTHESEMYGTLGAAALHEIFPSKQLNFQQHPQSMQADPMFYRQQQAAQFLFHPQQQHLLQPQQPPLQAPLPPSLQQLHHQTSPRSLPQPPLHQSSPQSLPQQFHHPPSPQALQPPPICHPPSPQQPSAATQAQHQLLPQQQSQHQSVPHQQSQHQSLPQQQSQHRSLPQQQSQHQSLPQQQAQHQSLPQPQVQHQSLPQQQQSQQIQHQSLPQQQVQHQSQQIPHQSLPQQQIQHQSLPQQQIHYPSLPQQLHHQPLTHHLHLQSLLQHQPLSQSFMQQQFHQAVPQSFTPPPPQQSPLHHQSLPQTVASPPLQQHQHQQHHHQHQHQSLSQSLPPAPQQQHQQQQQQQLLHPQLPVSASIAPPTSPFPSSPHGTQHPKNTTIVPQQAQQQTKQQPQQHKQTKKQQLLVDYTAGLRHNPSSSPGLQAEQMHLPPLSPSISTIMSKIPSSQPQPLFNNTIATQSALSDSNTGISSAGVSQTLQSIFSGLASDTNPLNANSVPTSRAALNSSLPTNGLKGELVDDTTRPLDPCSALSSFATALPSNQYSYKDFPEEMQSELMSARQSFGGNAEFHAGMMMTTTATSSSSASPLSKPYNNTTNDLQNQFMMQNASSVLGTDLSFSSSLFNGGLDDSRLVQSFSSAANSNAPLTRTYTKVYKTGSVGRSLDVTRFSNYDELRCELAKLFMLEGQLEDARSGWQLIFVDKEDDWLLLGDDPWEVFINNVRSIKIVSPSENNFQLQDGIGPFPIHRQTSSSSEDGTTQQESRNPSSVITSTCSFDY